MILYRHSLLNRLTGLRPMDALLTDDKVIDIMINGRQAIIVGEIRDEEAMELIEAMSTGLRGVRY
ncbi:MAG: CpaF/VirB11 family protein [Firmicutes bacterium]|nr:CpaF/VirB11 family protein [Bacillota bacterium]